MDGVLVFGSGSGGEADEGSTAI